MVSPSLAFSALTVRARIASSSSIFTRAYGCWNHYGSSTTKHSSNGAVFAERESRLLTLAEEFFSRDASSPAAKIETEIKNLENKLATLREKLVSAQDETR